MSTQPPALTHYDPLFMSSSPISLFIYMSLSLYLSIHLSSSTCLFIYRPMYLSHLSTTGNKYLATTFYFQSEFCLFEKRAPVTWCTGAGRRGCARAMIPRLAIHVARQFRDHMSGIHTMLSFTVSIQVFSIFHCSLRAPMFSYRRVITSKAVR